MRAPWRSLAAHVPGSPALRAWQNGIRGYTYVLRTYVGHSVRTHVRTYVYTHVRPHTYPNSVPGTYVRMHIVRTRWAFSPSPTVCVAAHFLPRALLKTDASQNLLRGDTYVRVCGVPTYVGPYVRTYAHVARLCTCVRAICAALCWWLAPGLHTRPACQCHVSVRTHVCTYVRTQHCTYVRAQKKNSSRGPPCSRARSSTYVRAYLRVVRRAAAADSLQSCCILSG